MPGINPEIKARAIKYFASHDLGSDEQTLIAVFLQNLKSANATVASKVIAAKLDWLPFRFIHEQYFKELELVSLLGHSTQWSMHPQIYALAAGLNLKFVQQTKIAQYMLCQFSNQQDFYEYLALSHAMMSQVRFIHLLPFDKALDSQFLDTLNEIEVQNGRMLQTQIRLLKDMDIALTLAQREEIIDHQFAAMSELFGELLTALIGLAPTA